MYLIKYAIHSDKNQNKYKKIDWTKKMYDNIYNAYPIYDWITEDIWVFNNKFNHHYNKLYDLYHQAGLTIDKMRVASPVYNVKAVPLEKIRANSYNPNSVASPEMNLLEISIWEDGYTMPVVAYYIPEEDIYEIVDGFHRYTTLKNSDRIRERENGMLPVVVIEKDINDRMASTIRHNRARGTHSIELMSNIVSELTQSGMSDAWILKHIGMDKDELLRLKQITGLASLFENKDFSIPQ